MALLQDILYKVHSIGRNGSTMIEAGRPRIDSREIEPGDIFIAINGVHVDGHLFIDKAVAKGAKAVICERFPDHIKAETTYIRVEDSADAAGIIASNYFGNPSEKLELIGVTGTNGKTTIATLLFQLFRALGYSCGLLSTVKNQINDLEKPSTHTTTDVIHFNELLAEMVKQGCDFAFAEVSSHAIHQKRIAGLNFRGGIFSNITHDHLDYHKTFAEYLRVKKSFFDGLPSKAFALSNMDDKHGMVMLQNTSALKKTYGIKNMADYKGKVLENDLSGLIMMVGKEEVHFRMTGFFNAYNLLAVYGAAVELGENKQEVLEKLSGLTGAEGRFDLMLSPKEHIMAIVDYAHTPDALLNVLETINDLRKGKENIITVVGCGGNRDKTKRPEMGQVAVKYSDKVIFTSDNPRDEDPDEIIREIVAGVPEGEASKTLSVTNRKEAIKVAMNLAQEGDIVLVAGKGHEKYQEIKGVKHPFDDKVVISETFKELKK